jgi:hypothetical protein
MLEHDSRYYNLKTAEFKADDGSIISYKKRRFLPKAETMHTQAEVTVTEGERPDLIAARIYGDSEQFWRICDANNTMNPFELTEKIGAKLRIAEPGISADFSNPTLNT